MRVSKKQIFGGTIILIIIVIYFSGEQLLNYFINKHLPQIIAEKNDTPYNLTYKKVNYSLALRRLIVKEVAISPKDTIDPRKTTIKGNLKAIEIQGVAIWELIRKHNLRANKIALLAPDITVWKSKDSLSSNTPHKKIEVTNSIDISSIVVKQAHVLLKDAKTKDRLNEVYNFYADIQGVYFGAETKEKPIPFTYEKYQLSCDSIYNRLNDKLNFTIGNIEITPSYFNAAQLKITPSANTSKQIDGEDANIVNLNIPNIKLEGTDWGYKNDKDFYLKISSIISNSAEFEILSKKSKTQEEIEKAEKTILPPLVPFDLNIDNISIRNFSLNSLGIWDTKNTTILFNKITNKVNDKFTIEKIEVEGPTITHTPSNTPKKDIKKQKLKQISDHISVDSLVLKNANFIVHDAKENKSTIEINAINSTIESIEINALTTSNKIPFTYGKSTLSTGKFHYDTGKYYDLYSDSIVVDNNNLKVTNFILKPKYSRAKMVSMFKYADDIFTLNTKEISIDNYKWGFDESGEFYFNTKLISIEHLDANIFRDKNPPHNPSIKPLFSKKLRDLKFAMFVDELQIKKSKLVYEELDVKSVAPGKITFSNFNATINNIASGYKQTKLPLTTIKVDASFMNAAPLHVDWSFNILNKKDQFNIRGTINNFPATAMQPFLQPYVKASTDGTLDLVKFNFNGDNKTARGTFEMKYENLKVTLYRKDGKAKKKVLSALGNLFIRDSTKGEVKTKNIKEVERVEDKSFFNYLWLCVLQGLKQTIL
ncbi:DUF748 domain-containing protein [Myroides injenensis]|uniref:DUF748 domain-containing protein n=2 Tax=Myroides injenensis TaxID=1183151 RepID=UPI000287CFE5|nr:DUF748 domain-containing protein [Myroides injenensis]